MLLVTEPYLQVEDLAILRRTKLTHQPSEMKQGASWTPGSPGMRQAPASRSIPELTVTILPTKVALGVHLILAMTTISI